MKTRLLPLYFKERNEREEEECHRQLDQLVKLYGEEAEFLHEQPIDECNVQDADV